MSEEHNDKNRLATIEPVAPITGTQHQMSFQSIPQHVQRQAVARPEAPAYYVRNASGWQATNWRDYAAEVRQVGKALIALGVPTGGTVGIIGFNCPDWTIFDVAAMSIGSVPVGIYTTNAPGEVRYIADHAASSVILVENAEQWQKIAQERERLPHLQRVVAMRGAAPIDDPLVLTWEAFCALGEGTDDAAFVSRLAAIQPDDLATLIYTSGTTGPPKGVMLSHRNLAWTAETAMRINDVHAGDCVLSYLPLSHVAEQMFTIHGASVVGYGVYYAESIERVLNNLREVQPQLFFGVPRIWEKFQAGVAARLNATAGVRRRLMDWAMNVGRRVSDERCHGREPRGALAAQYRLARKLVFSKIKPALGLGRARICGAGAAPIGHDVLEFFSGLDVIIYEVYGQSEDCGPTSTNLPGATRFGTVGKPLPGVEGRIADDGDILVRGPNVFLGYYKDPQASAETLADGWLLSGDLGEFDSEGFLRITGRKKDIIITAGGKNVTPKNIEAALKESPLINEAVVIGDRRKYLSVLLTLDADAAADFASRHALDPATIHTQPLLHAHIQAHVEVVNQTFSRVEGIKRFAVLARNFAIESGELTPTLKVKRKVVAEHFAREIEEMYEEE